MKKYLTVVASGLMAGATFMFAATPAMAERPRVDWSINIGSLGYYPPPPVYGQPQAIYSAPYGVYAQQAPMYPRAFYGYQEREWQERQWRQRQWRERQWREERWHGHHGHHDHDRDD